ncbi:PH domain-containing protein [Phytohabitans sp. ZYX-F-186]|uniref:PH domain-containing protein n=1 Tax=Phytohabitans maris TaxID=3071409 RepID=A0ABU0ZLZ7_9ACTN|nr:PH domain-containing protein [Phytohabitans sp. ZYX-F-186]MDQ7908003.1 PH domain-containing protein [Phytohabitans sp. ZYX-F-186]
MSSTVVRLRPQRARAVAWILAVAILVVFTLVATGLSGSTGDGYGTFQRGDQLAMFGLGVLFALGILLFTRLRVEADEKGIRVRNLVGGYDLPWDMVRSIRFNRGTPWATLELRDEDLLPMMALQAADKGYAVDGVRALRALLEAAQRTDEAQRSDAPQRNEAA